MIELIARTEIGISGAEVNHIDIADDDAMILTPSCYESRPYVQAVKTSSCDTGKTLSALTTLSYELYPWGKAIVGRGGYAIVFRATEAGTEKAVAIKKSRVSKTVERPILRHEIRLLQLLKGHPTIPTVYGYGQLDHFEYIAMELLGPSVADKMNRIASVMVKTVIRIMEQVLGGLKHIHSLGIVHRDMKPSNLLCALDEAESTIKIIDFGISKPFSRGQPSQYDPAKDRRAIVGSLYWASLNSHNGIDLSPRDDMESSAYTALYLLRGNLPWTSLPQPKNRLQAQETTRLMKLNSSGEELSEGFPSEFGTLLTYSRSLDFSQLPDHDSLRRLLSDSISNIGESSSGPLDWTLRYTERTKRDVPVIDIPDQLDLTDDTPDVDPNTDSYFASDIDMWDDRHGERKKDLTLPTEQEAYLDSCTPLIIEIYRKE